MISAAGIGEPPGRGGPRKRRRRRSVPGDAAFIQSSDFVRDSCQARLFRTVIPIRRSEICVTTGPLPALIRRCPVQTLKPLTSAHCAMVITRWSSSARASSSRSEWWWRDVTEHLLPFGGVLISSCSDGRRGRTKCAALYPVEFLAAHPDYPLLRFFSAGADIFLNCSCA